MGYQCSPTGCMGACLITCWTALDKFTEPRNSLILRPAYPVACDSAQIEELNVYLSQVKGVSSISFCASRALWLASASLWLEWGGSLSASLHYQESTNNRRSTGAVADPKIWGDGNILLTILYARKAIAAQLHIKAPTCVPPCTCSLIQNYYNVLLI